MTAPPVSVCLTTYNRALALPATLDSILSQEMGDFELIVSDDGSADGTEDICRSYAARDRRVLYFRNEANLKMPGNLNAAIRKASAPLVANLHDGDVYRADLLQKWKAALDEEGDAAFVFNSVEAVDREGCHVCFHLHEFGSRIDPLKLTTSMLGQLTSPVWGTVMARRVCYERCGLFNPRYGFISDVEMWMRLNIDFPVAYIPEPLITITPREVTHPYAYIDWGLEQIAVNIHRDIISLLTRKGFVSQKEALRQLQKLREKRWLFLAGSCVKKRRRDLLLSGLSVFRADESRLLKAAGYLGLPLALATSGAGGNSA